MQQQQPGTVTHSCSLLISWRLTRLRVASRYSARTSSYFKVLTRYLPVSSDNNYLCYKCVNVPEVGMATKKFLSALGVPAAEPPFLNFYIRHCHRMVKLILLFSRWYSRQTCIHSNTAPSAKSNHSVHIMRSGRTWTKATLLWEKGLLEYLNWSLLRSSQ